MVHTVREEGVSVAISEDMAMIAKFAGYDGREREFASMVQRRFNSADVAGVAELVERFNAAACGPSNTVVFRPSTLTRAAVGN